jgi:DNA-binding LacI/PurR family transcriptional regulator
MQQHGKQNFASVVSGGLTDATGYQAAVQALIQKPTALFVANDIAAMGAIAAIEEAGLSVPADVSVVGYDGISLGALRNVNLTTIAQPLDELGRQAAKALVQRIKNPGSKAQHIQVSSKLVVRGTTAAI